VVNSLETLEIGSMKHSLSITEEGLVTAHAILQRNGEEEYRYVAGQPWLHIELVTSGGRFDVDMGPSPAHLTQVAGPTSLETLDHATGESLRDLGVLRQGVRHPAPIRDVRAAVERLPYLSEGRNDEVDTAALAPSANPS
jgi:glycine cleavage system aminomethyltransferase T